MKGRKKAAPQMAEGVRVKKKKKMNEQVETKERWISAKTDERVAVG